MPSTNSLPLQLKEHSLARRCAIAGPGAGTLALVIEGPSRRLASVRGLRAALVGREAACIPRSCRGFPRR